MNTKLLAGIFAIAALSAGCNKSPTITTDSNAHVQAEPFHGEIYRSVDGRTVLTLISRDECELREGGTTLLCKYTKQADALRVVATAMGTNQVLYYRFTDQGIQDNNGSVLLSPDRYKAATEQIRLAREREEQAQQQAERMRLAEDQRKREAEARLTARIEESKKESKVLATFKIPPPDRTMLQFKHGLTLTVADSNVRCDNSDGTTDLILFSDYTGLDYSEGTDLFNVIYHDARLGIGAGIQVYPGGHKAAQKIYDQITKAYEDWKKRFPEAAQQSR